MQMEKEIPINNSTGSRQILNARTALSSHTFCCEAFLSSYGSPSNPFLEAGGVPGNPGSHDLRGKAKHSHCHFFKEFKGVFCHVKHRGSGWTSASCFQHQDRRGESDMSDFRTARGKNESLMFLHTKGFNSDESKLYTMRVAWV